MKKKISEIFVVICVFYTIISLVGGYINASASGEFDFYENLLMMFIWTSIATIVLYCYPLFHKLPPVLAMVIQYVIAQGLILLIIWVSSFFGPLHPNAYRDAVRSFTIPYVIGAAVYYIATFREAKKNNDILQEIRRQEKKC